MILAVFPSGLRKIIFGKSAASAALVDGHASEQKKTACAHYTGKETARCDHQPEVRQGGRAHLSHRTAGACRRGDQISKDFAALRMSAYGTKRRIAAVPKFGRYRR